MSPIQFIEFLESPGKLDDKSLPQLDEIVKTFPYCQSAHLLLAINLHNQKSIHYPAQLKRAAIYALDRSLLYSYIMQPGVVAVIGKVEEMEESAKTRKQENKKTSNAESAKTEVDAGKKNISPLEKEILKEAISASIMREVIEEQSGSATEETPPGHSALVKSVSEDKAGGQEEGKTRKRENEKPALSEVEVPGLAAEKISSDQPKTFNQWLKVFSKEAEMETLPDEENNDLEITSEFFSPSNLARMSAVDDESFVTETLAKIHLKQGNYAKAIRIYELLIEQNPEKEKEYREMAEEIKKLKNKEE